MLRLRSQWLRARVGILSSMFLDFKQSARSRGELLATGRNRVERVCESKTSSKDVPKVTCAAKQHALYLAPQKRDDTYELAVLSSVFCNRARMPWSLESP